MSGLTKDDIFHMAREAGGLIYEVDWCFEVESLERFAALVAAAEREECAKVIENVAQSYIEPVWAFTCVKAIRARGPQKNG